MNVHQPYKDAMTAALKQGELRNALEEGYNLVMSMFVHVSHGGPTREEAKAWLDKAGKVLGKPPNA